MTVKFPVPFHIDVGLQRSRRDDEANLRSHANDPGFKGTETISGAAIRRDLFIEITDRADLNLLGQELRGAPIANVSATSRAGRGRRGSYICSPLASS